jgi:hypothetical protein
MYKEVEGSKAFVRNFLTGKSGIVLFSLSSEAVTVFKILPFLPNYLNLIR